MSNSLDPDQDRYSVGPDLDPNSLQRLKQTKKFAEQAELTCFSQSFYEIHAGFVECMTALFFSLYIFLSKDIGLLL